nr:uncharacterized protein LOC104094230 [Nicotiana tomentosiformis]
MKSFIVKTDERLDANGAAIKELGTGLQNLEKQVGQILVVLSERIQVVAEKESGEKLKIKVDKKKKGKKGTDKKKEDTSRREEINEGEHIPGLPFPQNLYREKLDKKFERFLYMLKQVNVNLPFPEVLSQMPAYGTRNFDMSLCDSGTSINLMPLPIYRKMENEIGEIRVGEETVTFETNVETRVKQEKPAASVEWKVKSSRDKAPVIEKDKCEVYP